MSTLVDGTADILEPEGGQGSRGSADEAARQAGAPGRGPVEGLYDKGADGIVHDEGADGIVHDEGADGIVTVAPQRSAADVLRHVICDQSLVAVSRGVGRFDRGGRRRPVRR